MDVPPLRAALARTICRSKPLQLRGVGYLRVTARLRLLGHVPRMPAQLRFLARAPLGPRITARLRFLARAPLCPRITARLRLASIRG